MRKYSDEYFNEQFVDLLGRLLHPGDYFAFPLGAGRSQCMTIFRLVAAEVVRTERTWEAYKTTNGQDWPASTFISRSYKIKAQKINDASSRYNRNYTGRVSTLYNGENALKVPAEDVEAFLRNIEQRSE